MAKALAFLNSGASLHPGDVPNGAIFSESYRGLVLVQDIEFYSLCEHHLPPFHGRGHLAYLPHGKVIGLSKLPRLLDGFARRLQVQERLTEQLARAVEEAIAPRGVAVMLDGAHFCMMMRASRSRSRAPPPRLGWAPSRATSPCVRSPWPPSAAPCASRLSATRASATSRSCRGFDEIGLSSFAGTRA